MMPGLDGTATISEIRKIPSCKNTHAIFITAKIIPPEVAELMSHDAAVIALIHKPFDPDKIGALVQSFWDEEVNG